MTKDKARKRNTRARAAARGDSYTYTHRTDPQRAQADEGEPDADRDLLPMADLERYLDQAEKLFQSSDPYERQRGYAHASSLYTELARHTKNPTWAMAATMASQMYGVLASRVRWEHRIPTIFPKAEAFNLHLGHCQHCGRPWQGGLDGACEHCPQLLFGATPDDRDQAPRMLPAATPIDIADLKPPNNPDDY